MQRNAEMWCRAQKRNSSKRSHQPAFSSSLLSKFCNDQLCTSAFRTVHFFGWGGHQILPVQLTQTKSVQVAQVVFMQYRCPEPIVQKAVWIWTNSSWQMLKALFQHKNCVAKFQVLFVYFHKFICPQLLQIQLLSTHNPVICTKYSYEYMLFDPPVTFLWIIGQIAETKEEDQSELYLLMKRSTCGWHFNFLFWQIWQGQKQFPSPQLCCHASERQQPWQPWSRQRFSCHYLSSSHMDKLFVK